MKVIFHNDDFGLTYGFTEGIKESYLNKSTTSTSIRTNGTAFNDATELLKTSLKKIGVGIHLNLTDGPCHTQELSTPSGKYKFSVFEYFMNLKKVNRKLLSLIESELKEQFKICFKFGLPIDHVDGQDHVHMIPGIFEIICKLCKKYDIKSIRLTRENLFFPKVSPIYYNAFRNMNFAKYLFLNYCTKENLSILHKYKMKTTSMFYGVLFSNFMEIEVIKAALENAKKNNYEIIEILSHPAIIKSPKDKYYTSDFIANYSNSKNRSQELSALKSKQLIDLIKKMNIEKATFANI